MTDIRKTGRSGRNVIVSKRYFSVNRQRIRRRLFRPASVALPINLYDTTRRYYYPSSRHLLPNVAGQCLYITVSGRMTLMKLPAWPHAFRYRCKHVRIAATFPAYLVLSRFSVTHLRLGLNYNGYVRRITRSCHVRANNVSATRKLAAAK